MEKQNENIVESIDGCIKIVKFNKPSRKNALDWNMYLRIIQIFDEVKNNDDIKILVLTGTGDFYSSGNDIKSATNNVPVIKLLIDAFITFPKVLVAIVNGPAVGIATTTLALCDLVFASVNSYFYTPFTKLGIVPEGCSTLTFPRLLGYRKALELLLFNHRMPAQEALDYGFVNYVYKPEELDSVWEKIQDISNLADYSLLTSKRLIRDIDQKDLLEVNEREMNEISKIAEALGNFSKSKI